MAQRSLAEIDKVLKDLKNCEKAVPIDVSKTLPKSIPRDSFALVYSCNVFHITPREVGRGILTNAAAALSSGGSLVIYGPFKLDGKFNNESNREFDAALRTQNKEWGYWDINDVTKEAKKVNNIVIKTDVHGSSEALETAIKKIEHSEVKPKIILCDIGMINETDVSLAKASDAILIGFNVKPNREARKIGNISFNSLIPSIAISHR